MHHDDEDAEERAWRRRAGRRGAARRWAQLALGLGVLGVLAVPGTRAAWTDPVPVSGAGFTAGTVDLKVDNGDVITTYTSMNLSTMQSGDSTAGLLTVKNAGTAPLRYHVDATASNADGLALGSTLAATVTDGTVSGTAPSATCTGTTLSGPGATFTGNLVGSAASPRSLAGGATETLCIQATLPNGSSALGATTNLGFTFNASTGTPMTGWTDSVAVSGTTLGTINAFYLGTNAAGNTTSVSSLPLRRSGPTLGTLFNYDVDRDTTGPGLLLRSSGAQAGRMQQWHFPVGSSPFTLSGTASLRIWSAVKDFSTTLSGSLQVTLYDCNGDGTGCNQLATQTPSFPGAWSGGSNTWVSKTLPVTTVAGSYTWPAGRAIGLAISNAGSNDIWLAYDTTTYRSRLVIQ